MKTTKETIWKSFLHCSKQSGVSYTGEIARYAEVTNQTATNWLIRLAREGKLKLIEKPAGNSCRLLWVRDSSNFKEEEVIAQKN